MKPVNPLSLLLCAVLPMAAQEHEGRRLFNGGPQFEYSKGVSPSVAPMPTRLADSLRGTQDVDLTGLGAALVFRLGESMEARPPVALEVRAVYRTGSRTEVASVTSFPAGDTPLGYAALRTRTRVKEISVDVPVRVYVGSQRRWLEGPYLMVGPAWCHATQDVDFSATGGTASGPGAVASTGSFGEARAGVIAGLGWTAPIHYSFLNAALTWRRLNGGTVQAQQRITLSLGWLF